MVMMMAMAKQKVIASLTTSGSMTLGASGPHSECPASTTAVGATPRCVGRWAFLAPTVFPPMAEPGGTKSANIVYSPGTCQRTGRAMRWRSRVTSCA
eukprot:11186840-Lingulodinium_polyedra.AAC.1